MKKKILTCAFICVGVLAASVSASVVSSSKADVIEVKAAASPTQVFNAEDLAVDGSTVTKTIYLKPNVDLTGWPFNNNWGIRLKGTNNVTLKREGQEDKILGTNGSTGIAIISGKLCFETGTGWSGVSFMMEEDAQEGDVIVINGTYTYVDAGTSTTYSITINNVSLTYMSGKWADSSKVYVFDSSNASLLENKRENISAPTIWFNRNKDDILPNKTGSDPGVPRLAAKASLTVVHANETSDVDINTSFFVYKDSYVLTAQSWATGRPTDYSFAEGDKITINGWYNGVEGTMIGYNFVVNKVELFVKDGKFCQDLSGIAKLANEQMESLKEEMDYSDSYITYVKKVITTLNRVPLEQKDELNQERADLAYYQERLIMVKEYGDAGRIVHSSTIEAECVDATSQRFNDPTGCIAKVNEIEPFFREDVRNLTYEEDYEEHKKGDIVYGADGKPIKTGFSCSAWDSYYTSNVKNDAYFVTPGGVKTYQNSRAAIYQRYDKDTQEKIEGEFRIVFVFASWAGTAYSPKPGDRYVVGRTGYFFDATSKSFRVSGIDPTLMDTAGKDVYLVEFEGADFIWTGENWIDTKSAPNLAPFIKAMDDVGEVEYTPECKAKIDAATQIYESMSEDELKWVVSSVDDRYNKLLKDYESVKAQSEANVVIELINDIGEVEYTPECKAKIDAAREAYDDLSALAKTKVPEATLKILTDAEATYERRGYELLRDEVEAKIDAIGDVDLTPECKARIDEAREAVDAFLELKTDVKISDEKLAKLVQAELEYNALSSFGLAVDDLGKISDVKSDEFYQKLVKAIALYNNISEAKKSVVADKYALLLGYIEQYNAAIASFNEAHEANSDLSANVTMIAVSALSTLALLGFAIGKKGLF